MSTHRRRSGRFQDDPVEEISHEHSSSLQVLLTLNVSLCLTFSARFSAMARSKLARILIASWGSIRPSLIKSSIVSMSASPILSPFSKQSVGVGQDKRGELRSQRRLQGVS